MNPIAHLLKQKICKNCSMQFKPTTGNQIYCSLCKPIMINGYKKKYREINREKLNRESIIRYYSNVSHSREIKRKWNNDPRNTKKRKYDPTKIRPYTPEQRKKITARGQARRNLKRSSIKKICSSNKNIIHHKRIEVHHIDLNTFNNNINNLCYLCSTCHKLLHRKLRLLAT